MDLHPGTEPVLLSRLYVQACNGTQEFAVPVFFFFLRKKTHEEPFGGREKVAFPSVLIIFFDLGT
jgi:hypothetical protein